MKEWKYDISVIIPVYNVAEYIDNCMKSLISQTFDFNRIEVVAVNDGSTDNSLEILKRYQEKYSNFVVLNKENGGCGEARNVALDVVSGKYILFLDADDTLNQEAIEKIVSFFEEHYDEVDLVSYKIIPILNGQPQALHYRYKFLNETGVYDLREKCNWYVCVTTMNYCVKNQFENNTKFAVIPNFRHEDQKFSMDIIKEKLKIGYVEEAEYLYLQQPQSITKTAFHACNIFDASMNFWEEYFAQYEHVPAYFQALYVNDINWKFKAGILLPIHYEGQMYKQQVRRISNLLKNVNDDVLLNHPAVDKYHKQYFLDLKDHGEYKVYATPNGVCLMDEDVLLYADQQIDVHVHKMKVVGDKLKFMAYIKSPVFMYSEKPNVYYLINNSEAKKINLAIRESSYSYHGSKEKCAKAYLFECEISLVDVTKIKFFVELYSQRIHTNFLFPLGLPLCDALKRYKYYTDKYFIEYNRLNAEFEISKATFGKKLPIKLERFIHFWVHDKKKLLVRVLAQLFRPRKEIWLYYDCQGVKKDNAYFQFLHDIEKRDGIKRYYVSNNTKKITKVNLESKVLKHTIYFKSVLHYVLYLNADKVITAFVEHENCVPFGKKTYTEYLDIAKIPEVIYLQHGVLHAHMPWKYSLDRLLLDREVVSTYFEVSNLKENYCFTDEHLIVSGMPRYDLIDNHVESKRKILFAPSWRSYLVGKQFSNYAALNDIFLESEFYKETYKFLSSKELESMLEKYDYELNFKLHPIFRKYEKFYSNLSSRIKINAEAPDSDYRIFITDFSSYVFDFVYLQRAILYFVPDYTKFKAGMNLYREVDLKFEDGLGAFCQTADEAIEDLRAVLENDGKPLGKYSSKMDSFFAFDDCKQRERIYQALIEER